MRVVKAEGLLMPGSFFNHPPLPQVWGLENGGGRTKVQSPNPDCAAIRALPLCDAAPKAPEVGQKKLLRSLSDTPVDACGTRSQMLVMHLGLGLGIRRVAL